MVAKAATKAGEFFCFHCGKQVAREDYDCRGCGSSFDRIVKAFRCPRCARILPVGAVVCPACGLGFKIRNVSGTKPLTKDEEMLVELIDWGKQPEAPAPESTAQGQVGEKQPGEAARQTNEVLPQAEDVNPPLEQPPADDMGTANAIFKADNAIRKGLPEAYRIPDERNADIRVPDMTDAYRRPNTPEVDVVQEHIIHTRPHERTGGIDRTDTEVIDISQDQRRAPSGRQASPPQERSMFQPDSKRGGLSNQILKKMLEEREREVISLKTREEEIARREAHLERRIRDYAAKRRELDTLRAQQSASPEQPPIQEHIGGDRIEQQDFPSDLSVDDRDGWLREQSRIKMGLIEIRNEMGPRDEMVDYYPPHTSGEVLAKMEALEEKIMDISREREEMSARLKRMEASMDDTRELLRILDQLLGRLPPEVIDEFSKSKEFKLYEKVLDNLKI